MVKPLKWLMIFILITSLSEAVPFMDAAIDPEKTSAHFPIEGTISITHEKSEKIDETSFQIEGKPFEVSLIKEVPMSAASQTSVAIYSFQLPPKKSGSYVLPKINVIINGKKVESTPVAYQVREEVTPSSSNSPIVFKLESTVIGPSNLYPGERTKLFYRISFNKSIDLSQSSLPMQPLNFKKVGDVKIHDYQDGDLTIQELAQEIEASQPGTFELGPSLIEGYSYEMKGGEKVYNSTLLKAQAPPLRIQVHPFPSDQQPFSFTGALGNIKGEMVLKTEESVKVGDPIKLQISVKGIANLNELRLPSLECQPGFSGFFQFNPLPPLSVIEGDTKIFTLDLAPLTSLIQEIPSIELSSFDTEKNAYVIARTSPIPLKITSRPLKHSSTDNLFAKKETVDNQWPVPPPVHSDIKLHLASLNDWHKASFGLEEVLWLIVLAASLLLLQKYFWKFRKKETPLRRSEKLLRDLKLKGKTERDQARILENALWNRLWEKNHVKSGSFSTSEIPPHLEEVKNLILIFQQIQYGSEKNGDLSNLIDLTNQSFVKIDLDQ